MGRKLAQSERTRAIVNHAWDAVKGRSGGIAPGWNYIALCALVDRILTENNIEDGRDLGDAIVLCWELGDTPTMKLLLGNMERVGKGRMGRTWVA